MLGTIYYSLDIGGNMSLASLPNPMSLTEASTVEGATAGDSKEEEDVVYIKMQLFKAENA